MKTRKRERVSRRDGGLARFNSGMVLSERRYSSDVEDMTDVTSKKKDIYGLLPSTPMTHRKVRILPAWVSGSSGSGSYDINCNMVCNYYTAQNYLAIPPAHSNKAQHESVYVNELLARSNPFRSEYSIPVGLKEMAEVTSLFKFAAKSVIGIGGSAYLQYRFGMASLVRDLKTIMNLAETIEKRVKEYRHFLETGGLRRRVFLDRYTTNLDNGIIVTNSSPSGIWTEHRIKRKFSTEVRGTVRWFPAPGAHQVFDQESPVDEFIRVARRVLDLETPDLLTAWQLIPFSWLADYFFDLSAYLGATRGDELVTADYLSIIYETQAVEYASLHRVSSGCGSSSGVIRMRHVRRTTPPSAAQFPTSLPVITWSEAKAIAALLSNFKR